MTTNSLLIGQILRRLTNPDQWNAGAVTTEYEIQQIERAFTEYDQAARMAAEREKGGLTVFQDVQARSAHLDIPISRGITYSFVTNGTGLVDGTWRDLAFSSSRGYIKQGDACVSRKAGSTDKFVRNLSLKSDRSILIIAEVGFDLAGVTAGGFEIALDYYTGGVYGGSYTAYGNWHPDFVDGVTLICPAHDTLDDNEEVRLSVLQWGTGTTVDLLSANLTFLLA